MLIKEEIPHSCILHTWPRCSISTTSAKRCRHVSLILLYIVHKDSSKSTFVFNAFFECGRLNIIKAAHINTEGNELFDGIKAYFKVVFCNISATKVQAITVGKKLS